MDDLLEAEPAPDGDKRGQESHGDRGKKRKAKWASKLNRLDFHEARDGDHFMMPFQCDRCVYRLLTERDVSLSPDATEVKLRAAIRRVILDSFWSRARSTVIGNAQRVRQLVVMASTFGMAAPFGIPSKFPEGDHSGYFLAVSMVLKSLSPGLHSASYVQFDTIRQLRSTMGTYESIMSHYKKNVHGVTTDKGMYLRFTGESSHSLWFEHFARGCKTRMGQDWRPNKALSTQLVLEMVAQAELLMDAVEDDMEELSLLITATTYFVLCYAVSLRGPEGLMLNLEPLRTQPGLDQLYNQMKAEHVKPFFQVTLYGKFKGEAHIRDHVLPCVEVTSSGLQVKKWVDLLIATRAECGHFDGPAIVRTDGTILGLMELDAVLHRLLEGVYAREPQLFPPDVRSVTDIAEKFGAFRTMRKTSNGRAISEGKSKTDINLVNRWSSKEKQQGKKVVNQDMSGYYADWSQILPSFIRYSFAM